MKISLSHAHPEETILLAYLDAELPKTLMRSTKEHLQTCWKCRAAVAELESKIQTVSKLLSHQDESDMTRAEEAKAKFFERKSLSETRARRSVIRISDLVEPHTNRRGRPVWLKQTGFQLEGLIAFT